jgi:hypothetical protein
MTTRYASGRREGITEDVVHHLSNYEEGPFSEREKAALGYANKMFIDHHGIDEEQFGALREHFSDEEIVELSWAIGEFISLGKLVYVFGIPYGNEGIPGLRSEDPDVQRGEAVS